MPPVALLAGGLATRLHPLTEKMPKALIEVAGEPFIAHQLRLLRREGIHRVVLCLGFLGEMVRDVLKDGSAYGVALGYSFDGDKLLGTGGALKQALPQLGEHFFVLYGDSYLDIAYAPVYAAFRASGVPALMTVFRNEGRWDTSNVLFDGTHVVRYDKRNPSEDMGYIDYGLGLFKRKAIADWPEQAFDLAEVYAKLAEQGKLAGYEVSRRFYEIGTRNGLAETDAYLRGSQ
jgi:N-acetyl-alpha-D-muramate 1-phosphate uridylyltransferase